MNINLEDFWKNVLGEVELEISRPNFVTWLKGSRLVDKYNKLILRSLRALDQSLKRVEYTIDASQHNKILPQKTPVLITNQLAFQEFRVDPETNLNPRYTLSSFIVGSSNELAYAATTAVINEIGTKYNPLFIYGGVGLGKTHLLQAMGNEIKNLHKNKKRIVL